LLSTVDAIGNGLELLPLAGPTHRSRRRVW